MSTSNKKAISKNFVLFYPIPNLLISKDFGGEIQIGRVHFISKEKIPFVRKRIGFRHTISELNKYWEKNVPEMKNLFNETPSYAFIHFRANSFSELSDPDREIKEALWILVSSQFYRENRGNVHYFGLPEHKSNVKTETVIYDKSERNLRRSFQRLKPYFPYKLDKLWRHYLKRHFFFPLLKILNRTEGITIKKKWRDTLRNVSILIGKSHFSKDLPLAFLYDFIAIESLLLADKEPHHLLSERLNGLFGWMSKENPKKWENIIKGLIDLRNEFVHSGNFEGIKTIDLVNADNILYNLFNNICRNINFFQNKEALIDLSRKVKASRILGLKVKVRPSMIFEHLPPSTTIDMIKKKNYWP
ncbi:hypothetical protein ACFLQZ_02860 [Acidobacteriota bacterium]